MINKFIDACIIAPGTVALKPEPTIVYSLRERAARASESKRERRAVVWSLESARRPCFAVPVQMADDAVGRCKEPLSHVTWLDEIVHRAPRKPCGELPDENGLEQSDHVEVYKEEIMISRNDESKKKMRRKSKRFRVELAINVASQYFQGIFIRTAFHLVE